MLFSCSWQRGICRQRDSWCLFLALSVSLLLPFLSLALFSLTLHNYVWFVFRYNIIQYLNCTSAARTGSTIDGRDDVGVGCWGVVVVTLRWVRAPITEEESAEKPISARSDIRFCYSQRGKWKQTADRNKLQVQDCRAVDHLISRLQGMLSCSEQLLSFYQLPDNTGSVPSRSTGSLQTIAGHIAWSELSQLRQWLNVNVSCCLIQHCTNNSDGVLF